MSNIGSVTSYLPSVSTLKSIQTNYEDNARAYGPVAAGVAGLAAAAGEVASTVCSFSADSLGKLGNLTDEACSSVTGVIDDIETAVSDGVTAIEDAAASVVTGVSEAASTAATEISDAASAVTTGISKATSSVVNGVGSAANSVAGYATMGLVAARQTLSELA